MRMTVGLAAVAIASCACSGGRDATPATGVAGCSQEVVVYLDAGATPARQRHLARIMDEMPEVDTTKFHSPREAFLEFKAIYKDQPEVYEGRRPSDFPGTFEVTLTRGTAYEDFEAPLVGTPGIDTMVPGPCRDTLAPATNGDSR